MIVRRPRGSIGEPQRIEIGIGQDQPQANCSAGQGGQRFALVTGSLLGDRVALDFRCVGQFETG